MTVYIVGHYHRQVLTCNFNRKETEWRSKERIVNFFLSWYPPFTRVGLQLDISVVSTTLTLRNRLLCGYADQKAVEFRLGNVFDDDKLFSPLVLSLSFFCQWNLCRQTNRKFLFGLLLLIWPIGLWCICLLHSFCGYLEMHVQLDLQKSLAVLFSSWAPESDNNYR